MVGIDLLLLASLCDETHLSFHLCLIDKSVEDVIVLHVNEVRDGAFTELAFREAEVWIATVRSLCDNAISFSWSRSNLPFDLFSPSDMWR